MWGAGFGQSANIPTHQPFQQQQRPAAAGRPVVSFPKEAELHTPQIKELLQYRLENSGSLAEVYALANTLLEKQEWTFVQDVCTFAQAKIKSLDKARRGRQLRRTEINKIKAQATTTVHEKQCLEFEEELFNGLPAALTLTNEQLEGYKYQFAELMIRSALTRKTVLLAIEYRKKGNQQQELLDDKKFDVPVVKIIENAVAFVSSADQLMEICRVIDSSGSPKLAIPVAKAAYEVQMQVRAKLLAKTELHATVQLLEQERERMKRLKKDLSAEKLTELAQLRLNHQNFEMPFTGSCNSQDINAMEQQALQITLMMLACAMNVKKNLVTKRREVLSKAAVLTKEEQEMINDPRVVGRMIEKILSWAIPERIQDPAHMMQVVKNTEFENQLDYVFSLSEKVRKAVLGLKAQLKDKQAANESLKELRRKRSELLDQWKILDGSDAKELYHLEFKEIVENSTSPSFKFANKDKLDTLEKNTLTWIIDCIYNEKQELEDKVANPRKYPTFKQLSAAELAKRRANFSEQVLRVTNDIQAPMLLFHLSKHIQSRRDSDIVFKVGNKCQVIIKGIEELRAVRAPLHAERDALLSEKADLLRRKREFPADKQQKVKELEAKIAELPEWPEFASLHDHHQYDELNLDIVRVMTSAILDNKTTLEEDIARMFKETAPENIDYHKIERDRNAIQVKIQQLTKQCLTQFSNPVYLLRFAKDMKNRRETEVVLEVVAKCLEIIQDIDSKRKVRKPVQLLVNELEREKEDPKKTFGKEEELKKLKQKLDDLPAWPHFADVMDDNQYSKTVFHCIHVVLNSVLDKREELESSIAKQIYENKRAVDEHKVAEDRKQKEEQIVQALSACYRHITTPEDLQNLANSMFERKEAEVLIKVAIHAFSCIERKMTILREGNNLSHKIRILKEEDASLRLQKKSLSTELQAEKASLKEARTRLSEEEGWKKKDKTTIVLLDAIRDNIVQQVVTTTFDTKKRLEQKIEKNNDLSEERIEYFKNLSTTCVNSTLKLLKSVSNPSALYNIVLDLYNRKEYIQAAHVAELCYKKLAKLQKERAEYAEQTRDRLLLLEEEKALAKVLHRLPEEKKATLRKLEFEHRQFQEGPSYYHGAFDTDNFAFNLACLLINITKTRLEKDDDDEMEVEKESEAAQIKSVVEMGLEHITLVPNIIKYACVLRDSGQHGMVVLAGKYCQQKIFEQKQEYEEREKLKEEFERLDNLRLTYLFKKEDAGKTDDINKKLEETQALLAKLPKIDDLKAQIDARNNELLRVIDLVIAAAKIEDLQDELRDQTILAFKTDTTTQRWDTIRQIVPEEEWLKIKEELVVYVIQQDTNTHEKIELLLKDGLYKQVLEVFPKPSGEKSEMDLLARVYRAVENAEPELLEKLIPIIGIYMKHYFSKQDYEVMDNILERLQRRFPSIIINLFSRACEMLMFNIMPSQYNKFVKMLSSLKQRMEGINRQDDWNDFFQEFKKKHKGKSKLIQMVSLIGDSMWDLESIMQGPPKKKRKIMTSTTTSSSTASRPKTKKAAATTTTTTTADGEDEGEENTQDTVENDNDEEDEPQAKKKAPPKKKGGAKKKAAPKKRASKDKQ